MYPKQVIIFDLFDTLLQVKQTNFKSGLYLLWKNHFIDICNFEAMAAYSDALYPIMKQHQKNHYEFSFVGNFIASFCRHFGVENFQITVEEEAEIICRISQCVVHPETIQLLQTLKMKSLPVYILSNSIFSASALTLFIRQFGLNKWIDTVFTSADLGYRKPSTKSFERCIKKIHQTHPTLTKSQILFIGNSYSCDATGGVNSGLETIWLNINHEINLNKLPIRSISSLSQIKSSLRNTTPAQLK